MSSKFIGNLADMAGTAVPGCGTIHKSEIKPTLDRLSSELEFHIDLYDYMLGSTGKKEYSGDVDVVLDRKYYNGTPKEFTEDLKKQFGDNCVKQYGNMVHLKYPIVNYKPEYNAVGPRTGFVQIDFNLGNADWERLYHFSPGDASEYKGGHRNLALSAVCSSIGVIRSPVTDSFERPVSEIRWKWGPSGFVKINRHSVYDKKKGKWLGTQKDEILEGPYYDAAKIFSALFPIDGTEKDLESFETVFKAVKRNYGMVDQERIWTKMAFNFSEWNQGKDYIYPPEIEQYFLRKDK